MAHGSSGDCNWGGAGQKKGRVNLLSSGVPPRLMMGSTAEMRREYEICGDEWGFAAATCLLVDVVKPRQVSR